VAALVYSVAVESVLGLVRSPYEPDASAEVFAECRDRLLTVLGEDPAPEHVRKRLQGLLENASQVRPVDHLHALANAGAITPGLVRVWKRVRGATAHGGVPVDLDKSPEELVLLVEQVATLLYELVFHLIGYEGLYATYADGRGRVRLYPPAA
jgi:hypothetical protein